MLFTVPDGTFFNPDFGLEFGCKPDLSGIRDEANAVLATYGYSPLTVPDLELKVQEISSEVGDDEESVSNSKAFIALLPVMHSRFGQKVSWKDTSIHSHYGNFSEDLVLLPASYYQTYWNISKLSGKDQDMAFLDVPKLRLAIDVRPGRMNHSSTNDGKCSMVASRNMWIPHKSPIKGIYEVYSLYQDVNLGLKRDKRFTYLPVALGGYGKPLPFNEPSNFRRFDACFRQGEHTQLNTEIVRRANIAFNSEGRFGGDLLLQHISRFQSQYHDWIKGRSIWCPVTWVDAPENLEKFKVLGLEDAATRAAANRLLAEGLLVSESQLSVRIEHNDLCNALLGSEDIVSFKRRRDEKIAEWRTLSIYNLKSAGYIKELNLESLGLTKLKDFEILSFFRSLRTKSAFLKAIFRNESLYWPEAMKEIYTRGPMMVPFNCLPKLEVGFTYAEHRWDVIDVDHVKAFSQLETWLRTREGEMPSVLINDDEKFLGIAKSYAIIVIITDDKALCRALNDRQGNPPVVRIPVKWYYINLYFGEGDPEIWKSKVQSSFPHWEIQVFEDTGSIASGEEALFHDGIMMSKRIRHPLNILSQDQSGPLLRENETLTVDNIQEECEFYDCRNALRLRRSR